MKQVSYYVSDIFEPHRDKTNKMACAPSLDIRSVWSEFSLCAQWVAKDLSFLHTDSEDPEQTGRMPRLIWVFAGRTCHFVGYVTMRLILVKFRSLNDHLSGKELFIRFTARAFRKLLSIYGSSFPSGFEDRIWDLIASVPDQCLSFYFQHIYLGTGIRSTRG